MMASSETGREPGAGSSSGAALKVIYSECSSEEWIGIAGRLSRDHGWRPVYWTATQSFGPLVRERFSQAIFHHNYDAVRGLPPGEWADMALPSLDEELLASLAYPESILLKMMDRLDPGEAFTLDERKRLYHHYLRYWSAVLDRLQPDVFVTPGVPHLCYDYVLYTLCRRRGIRTVMPEYTTVPGLVFAMEDVDEGPPNDILSYYRERASRHREEPVMLTERCESYWAQVTGSYTSGMPFYMKELARVDEDGKARTATPSWKVLLLQFVSSKWGRLAAYPQYARNAVRNFILVPFEDLRFNAQALRPRRIHRYFCVPVPTSYVKAPGRSIHEHLTPFEQKQLAGRGRRRVARLRERYRELSRPMALTQPYVFVGLHYQPERTTSPTGGVFVDQLLMIELLSQCLPPGWSLYVKEHPAQHLPFMSGHHCRSAADYERMLSVPGVTLLPASQPSFELIDAARAVATVSGTVGFEAVVRGKPVLIFGHAWYKGCEGVFDSATEAACRGALSRIAGGYTVDRGKVRLFLAAIEQKGFSGYFDTDFAKVAGMSLEENVSEVSRALVAFVAARARA